jgi:nitrogen fixation NifU-like protein
MTNLYQKDVLRHAAAAHRTGRLDDPDGSVMLDNPLCGDRVTIDIKLGDGAISDIAHEAKACVLCQASASILCDKAIGADASTLENVQSQISAMLKQDAPVPQGKWEALSIFLPVADHKSRHACVLLPFEAAINALRTVD